MRPLTLCLFVLLTVAGCSGGGHGDRSSSLTAIAPTVDGACLAPASCPEPVDCHPFRNPDGRPISVDPLWQERLDLCCGLRLCEVDGACLYGCPTSLINPGCR